jgi:hypothetical protein
MSRLLCLFAALSLSGAAFAQPAFNPNVQQVQQLAPQLLALAGSSANFESLVNGLTQGAPVTLTTVGADGSLQIVTFVAGTTLSPVDAARTLETARQSLISRGIATPSAQQLAIALMGGSLPTAVGTIPVTGVLSGNAGTTPIQVRTETVVQPTPGATAGNLSAANIQALTTALAQNTPVTLTGANGNVTFAAPGRPMSAFEINQALQLANLLLAQQGILNPTPEQLRAALLGGTLTSAGGNVPLQGILQGQVRNTSDSPFFGTSDSRVLGTSATPSTAAPGPRALTTAPAPTAAPTTAPAPRITAPRFTRR